MNTYAELQGIKCCIECFRFVEEKVVLDSSWNESDEPKKLRLEKTHMPRSLKNLSR